MTTYTSKHASGQVPVAAVTSALPQLIALEYTTEASLAAGDIIDLGDLPAGYTVMDAAIVTDDLDSNGTPTITLSLGALNAGKTDLDGTAYIAASTVGQAGGVARATAAVAYLAGSSARRMGLKVVAGAATGTGSGKKIAVLLTVKG